MSTFVGKAPEEQAPKLAPSPVTAEKPRAKEPEAAKPMVSEKTRAQLVVEAEELGIKIPKNANKAQIAKLIEDAPVM